VREERDRRIWTETDEIALTAARAVNGTVAGAAVDTPNFGI
jgi:hypothetical protein